jgi:type II secretory pathway pseudopilin PulG
MKVILLVAVVLALATPALTSRYEAEQRAHLNRLEAEQRALLNRRDAEQRAYISRLEAEQRAANSRYEAEQRAAFSRFEAEQWSRVGWGYSARSSPPIPYLQPRYSQREVRVNITIPSQPIYQPLPVYSSPPVVPREVHYHYHHHQAPQQLHWCVGCGVWHH